MSRSIMRKILLDSSSAILMFKCGALEYLLSSSICIIPESVKCELTMSYHDNTGFFLSCINSGLIEVEKGLGIEVKSGRMHRGEREVISLFLAGRGDYILIDDGAGAAYCRDKGIPYINALLAVKILCQGGVISDLESDKMYSWLKNNGRYSGYVIEWADSSGKEELSFFML